MAGSLSDIINWVDSNGVPKSVDRLNLALGMLCVKERIIFKKVEPSTQASPKLMEAARAAAQKIVGQACPV